MTTERRLMALSLTSMLAVLCIVALGMGRLPALDDSTIVYLPEPGCKLDSVDCWAPAATGKYVVQVDLGQGWVTLSKLAQAGVAPGDCIAAVLLEPHFRACCVCEAGSCCSEEAAHSLVRPTCRRIFDLMSGNQYSQDQVDDWNGTAAPTPAPTPLPPAPTSTPGPTPQPLPTMLPYLGACCFDFAKPWVCGLATEPTCQAQGGVRWTRQTPCSNELCSP